MFKRVCIELFSPPPLHRYILFRLRDLLIVQAASHCPPSPLDSVYGIREEILITYVVVVERILSETTISTRSIDKRIADSLVASEKQTSRLSFDKL